jgi:hypothetical protein
MRLPVDRLLHPRGLDVSVMNWRSRPLGDIRDFLQERPAR